MNRRCQQALILLSIVFNAQSCSKKVTSETGTPQIEWRDVRSAFDRDPFNLRTIQSQDGRPDWRPVKSFLARIGPNTSIDSPELTYLRTNLTALLKSGALDRFLRAFPEMVQAVKNPEFIRLMHNAYAEERDQRRYWEPGIYMIEYSGAKEFAPSLYEDWKKLPPADLMKPLRRNDDIAFASAPKMALARVFFRLGNRDVIEAVWRDFPSMAENDQHAILKAFGSYENALSIETVRLILEHTGDGKSDVITADLARIPSEVLIHIINQHPPAERPQVVGSLAADLALMRAKGLVTSDLAEILNHLPH